MANGKETARAKADLVVGGPRGDAPRYKVAGIKGNGSAGKGDGGWYRIDPKYWRETQTSPVQVSKPACVPIRMLRRRE